MIDYGHKETPPHVVCVNGYPRAGKDTLVDLTIEALTDRGVLSARHSTIDVIRSGIARAYPDWGVDVSAKTPADRALLVALGDALETHSEVKFRALLRAAYNTSATVLFVQVREPAMIAKIREVFPTTTVLVTNERATAAWNHARNERASNATDDAVHDGTITYDFEIENPFMGAPEESPADAMDHYVARLQPLIEHLAPRPAPLSRFADWFRWW